TVLPSGTNLRGGVYYTLAYAYDKAGNRVRSAAPDVAFTVDAAVPAQVVVTGPANGSKIRALSAITGNASDNTGGSGIARVEAYLRRKNSSGAFEYWAKREGVWGWGNDVASIPAKLSSPGAISTGWSVAANSPTGTVLPSGTDLRDGVYYTLAYAYDKAGNRVRSAAPDVAFTVETTTTSGRQEETASAAPTSSVTLSSASAGVDGLVTLTFTGGLNIDRVTDVSRYRVTVNGSRAGLESAGVRNNTTIVLSLGSIVKAGDQIEVKYDLLDSKGQSLAGETSVTVR
ncbi:MAG TPA: SwmB domain-containing protein, partial [Abditibacteriaceae bacterium]